MSRSPSAQRRGPAAGLLGLILLLTALPTASAVSADTTGVDPALATQLQAVLDIAQSDRPIVGLSATVTFADGSRWESGSGSISTAEGSAAFTADTPTVIGSITKTFVAALILKLVEEGRLSLDDRISRWFPEYPFAARVSVRDLLGHTSGIRDYFMARGYKALVFDRPTHLWSPAEILTLIRPRLKFAPGTSWSYSNTNYVFLGMIAERVTGATVGAQLRKRFWETLRMTHTYFQGENTLPADSAQGYLRRRAGWVGFDDGTNFRPNASAATVAWSVGNVLSSASDIATWTRALYGGTLLLPESLTQMLNFNTRDYGLGTGRYWVDGAAAWGHTGSLRGYTAVTWYLESSGITATVLTNRGRISPEQIAVELSRIALGSREGGIARAR